MPWSQEFTTGLIDDYDFTIQHAVFAPDAKYMDGNVLLLQWNGSTDNPELPETHLWFTLGNYWETRDGGRSIVRGDGKDAKFNGSTAIAKLINRCLDDFGIGDLLESRGTEFEAKVWEGLVFHIKQEPTQGVEGQPGKMKQFPNRFVGVVGAEANVVSAATATNAPDAAAMIAQAQAAANGNGSSTVASPLKSTVISVLKAHTDPAAANNAALQIDGVTSDQDILSSLLDGSLWAEAHA